MFSLALVTCIFFFSFIIYLFFFFIFVRQDQFIYIVVSPFGSNSVLSWHRRDNSAIIGSLLSKRRSAYLYCEFCRQFNESTVFTNAWKNIVPFCTSVWKGEK
jgi:hypothetical protein